MDTLKFEDKRGRTITVKNIENNIAILNNGEKVAIERLRDPNFYTPLNENNTFTNSTKTSRPVISDSTNVDIMDVGTDEYRYKNLLNNKSFAIGDSDDSMLHTVHRTNLNQQSEIRMSGSVVESHNQNLKSIGKEPMEEYIPVSQPYIQENRPYVPHNNTDLSKEEELLRKYGHDPNTIKKADSKLEELAYGKKVDITDDLVDNSNTNLHQVEDSVVVPEINPVHQMFDKAKRIHSLDVTLKLNEKIPSKDVIKMMEENFDESAVDYYTKDIFKRLMENPSVIEDQVKKAIQKYLNSRVKKSNKNDK